uniref:DUF834 domain-containing protein n=1 Tax=Oryza meridionalis TaxID=40149 RepID=A0A0E0EQ94_9ORYZ
MTWGVAHLDGKERTPAVDGEGNGAAEVRHQTEKPTEVMATPARAAMIVGRRRQKRRRPRACGEEVVPAVEGNRAEAEVRNGAAKPMGGGGAWLEAVKEAATLGARWVGLMAKLAAQGWIGGLERLPG